MQSTARLLFIIFALGCWPIAQVQADEFVLGDLDFEDQSMADNVPSVLLQTIAISGSVNSVDWKTESKWNWKKASGTEFKKPYVKTWIQIPEGVSLDSVESKGRSSTKNPGDSPFSGGGESFSVESDTVVTNLTVKVKTSKGLRSKKILMTQVFDEPYLLVHASCSKNGLEITYVEGESNHLYNAVYCVGTPSSMDMYLLHSTDSILKENEVPGKSTSGKHWVKHQLGDLEDRKDEQESEIIGLFRVGSREKGFFSEFAVGFGTPKTDRRLLLTGVLGFSYFNYVEDVFNIDLESIDLRGRVNFYYELIPGTFDIDGNVSGTVLPIKNWPDTITNEARFWRVDASGIYRIPLVLFDALRMKLGLGFYIWGMFVTDSEWGVQNISGPQLKLAFSFHPKGSRPIDFELKFAPIGTSLDFANKEIGLRLRYQLSPSTEQGLKWYIGVEYQNSSFTPDDKDNSLELTAYGLNGQVLF